MMAFDTRSARVVRAAPWGDVYFILPYECTEWLKQNRNQTMNLQTS